MCTWIVSIIGLPEKKTEIPNGKILNLGLTEIFQEVLRDRKAHNGISSIEMLCSKLNLNITQDLQSMSFLLGPLSTENREERQSDWFKTQATAKDK